MSPTIASAILIVVAVGALVIFTVRIVPMGTGAVVTRFGRLVKVVPAGLAFVVPFVDRVHWLEGMQPTRTDPVPVSATTRDGVDVRLTLSLLWQLTEPERCLHAVPDLAIATSDAAERRVHHRVAATDLREMLTDLEAIIRDLAPQVTQHTSTWGVRVLDLEVLDAELRLGPQLLRLMR